MRRYVLAACLWSVLAGAADAAERYTEARITQIEVHEQTITLFLQVVSGDAPPSGNGGSNEAVSKPYLYIASSLADIANRKHFLPIAMTAQIQGSTVRFRWEDTTSRIIVMLGR